jgi:chorismate dehydratase
VIRFARLRYRNALPVHLGLDWGDLVPVDGTPAQLAGWLASGRCEAGLLASAAYLADPDAYVPLGACIASRGPVESVLLVGRRPELLDGQLVAVTAESVTSVRILDGLLRGRYGVRARLVPRPEGAPLGSAAAELVIGDAALARRHAHPDEPALDLALAWREWTGRPAVFGLWVARADWARRHPREAARLEERIRGAAERGLAAAVAAHPELERYWTQCLHYRFGEDERAALRELAEVIGA